VDRATLAMLYEQAQVARLELMFEDLFGMRLLDADSGLVRAFETHLKATDLGLYKFWLSIMSRNQGAPL
jgi:polyphosphate kinase 2 (PPK2 family)